MANKEVSMSEFRIFAIGGFLGAGAFAAFAEHAPEHIVAGSPYLQLLCISFLSGCLAVTLFGRRTAA